MLFTSTLCRAVTRTIYFIGNLWYRQGITPSYPQGSTWDYVSNNIRKMSVGPLDQVCIKFPGILLVY